MLRRPVESALRAAVRVVNQGFFRTWLTRVQRLLQGIEHEVRVHGTAHSPPHDASGKDVDDESHIEPALPGRDIGEVRDPQLVGTIGLELPIDPIQWARRLAVADRGAHDLSPHDTPQSLTTHKSFDRAAGHRDTLPVQLPPDLIGAINLQVGLPDTLDLRDQCLIAFRSLAA